MYKATITVVPHFEAAANYKTHLEAFTAITKIELNSMQKGLVSPLEFFIRIDTNNEQKQYYQICQKLKNYTPRPEDKVTLYCGRDCFEFISNKFTEVDFEYVGEKGKDYNSMFMWKEHFGPLYFTSFRDFKIINSLL